MPNFFGFLDSFGLFFNTQLNSKRKKNIFLEKWALGVLSPQGPPGPPLGLRAKFGLVSDPGGLANDVSKAKNLIQIFPERMLVFLSHGLLSRLQRAFRPL